MDEQHDFPHLLAGDTTLDFANTAVAATFDPACDVLSTTARFHAWCAYAGIVPAAPRATSTDRRRLNQARRLRDAIHEIASAIVEQRAPRPDALDELRDRAAEGISHARSELGPRSALVWTWSQHPVTVQALWTLAHGASELFRHGPIDRIRTCDACNFLFIDGSKNRSRRWCSMDDCGKDAKMRRYIERRAARNAGPA